MATRLSQKGPNELEITGEVDSAQPMRGTRQCHSFIHAMQRNSEEVHLLAKFETFQFDEKEKRVCGSASSMERVFGQL